VPSIQDLEAQLTAARAATEAYSAEITEKYRAEYPLPDGWTGLPDPELLRQRAQAWTDAESEHLATLRAAWTAAAVELHRARQQAEGHTSGD
jgi:hypothetical protein